MNLPGVFSYSRQRFANWQSRRRIADLAQQVAIHAQPDPRNPAVVIFNASTRLTGLSLNAAFSLLTGWSLRLAGWRVIHFVCHSGMSHCVLGINRQDYTAPPPCESCIAQSERLYSGADVWHVSYQENEELAAVVAALSVEELSDFQYNPKGFKFAEPIPLGKLVIPSIRWTLRRYTLPDDDHTRYLLREYILSAYNIARKFAALLDEHKPQLAIIFNGIMYPEATARWIARQMDVRSVAHEVGFQPTSAFFTEGEPTAYPIHIPDDFELTDDQNERLNTYLGNRFQGKFTMAGIRFWPEMSGLDEVFLNKSAQFRQIVPIFTNVVYDTSQVHANVIFPHMFAWLDLVLEIIKAHPETLFVIRAHPDEMRPGTAKQSRESVRQWTIDNLVANLPNVVFIDSGEYISSYELIQRSKFAIVYNSSIGLEAILLGKAVVCAGKARYTQYPTVFFPQSAEAFCQQVEEFLEVNTIQIPAEFQRNARRFLYYQLYRTSLPFGDYLQAGSRMGFVRLRPFSWEELLPEKSITMNILHDGLLNGQSFMMPESN
jgi:hypothetical protein